MNIFLLGVTSCDSFLDKDMSHDEPLWVDVKIPIFSNSTAWTITIGLDRPYSTFTAREGQAFDMSSNIDKTRWHLSNGVCFKIIPI